MEQAGDLDGLSIVLDLESPTGDPTRFLELWVEPRAEGPDLSIGFGPSHTHACCQSDRESAILAMLRAILSDEIVIIEGVGGPYPGNRLWLDLREPDALADALTHRWSPDRVLVKSWSGKRDREVSLDDLSL